MAVVKTWPSAFVLQKPVLCTSSYEDLPNPCRDLIDPLPSNPCLNIQVQAEVHVGSAAMDTDWSEVQFRDVANGHSHHEAACQCTHLPHGDFSRVQRELS